MNDLFFLIGREHVDSGEFLPDEIGHWAVRLFSGGVLLIENRRDAERVWANIAHHHGYTYN